MKPLTLIAAVHADGGNEGPQYVRILIDDGFIHRLRRLRSIARAHQLAWAVTPEGGVEWEQNDAGERWGVDEVRLCASEDSWYVYGIPSEADWLVETEAFRFAAFDRMLAECAAEGLVLAYWGITPEEIGAIERESVAANAAPMEERVNAKLQNLAEALRDHTKRVRP